MQAEDGVNALKRATLISTFNEFKDYVNAYRVNALKRATLISTGGVHWLLSGWWWCVNALKRATLISTQ